MKVIHTVEFASELEAVAWLAWWYAPTGSRLEGIAEESILGDPMYGLPLSMVAEVAFKKLGYRRI